MQCKRCGEEFAIAYQRIHDRSCRGYKCKQCDAHCKTKKELEQHIKENHRKRFVCDLCNTPPFMSERSLLDHQKRAHSINILCSLCGKSFSGAFQRDRHMSEQHNSAASAGTEWMCGCGKTFCRSNELDRHQIGCILSKKGATIAVKRRFQELSDQTEDRNAACTQAFEEIRRMAEKRLECTCKDCGKHFKNEASLRKHRCSS